MDPFVKSPFQKLAAPQSVHAHYKYKPSCCSLPHVFSLRQELFLWKLPCRPVHPHLHASLPIRLQISEDEGILLSSSSIMYSSANLVQIVTLTICFILLLKKETSNGLFPVRQPRIGSKQCHESLLVNPPFITTKACRLIPRIAG